jgi:hypothetical protein
VTALRRLLSLLVLLGHESAAAHLTAFVAWWLGGPHLPPLGRFPLWLWRLRARLGCRSRWRAAWEGPRVRDRALTALRAHASDPKHGCKQCAKVLLPLDTPAELCGDGQVLHAEWRSVAEDA